MAVVSSFDQWEKDVFFSAAEEVQESADVMESLYRTWHHGCTSGICSEDLEELERELQAALGTAKWQLEQFEQAIALNHEIYPSEENTISRRRQFVSAIETQIKTVEISLTNNLTKGGKPSFSWIKLEEGERDDFVTFLSSDFISNKKPNKDEVIIPIENSSGFLRGSEAQPRIKLVKNADLKVMDEEITPKPKNLFLNDRDLKGNSVISQLTRLSERSRGCLYRFKEHLKSSNNMQLNYARGDRTIIRYSSQLSRSVRATFLLLMSIFLIVPFLVYAT